MGVCLLRITTLPFGRLPRDDDAIAQNPGIHETNVVYGEALFKFELTAGRTREGEQDCPVAVENAIPAVYFGNAGFDVMELMVMIK